MKCDDLLGRDDSKGNLLRASLPNLEGKKKEEKGRTHKYSHLRSARKGRGGKEDKMPTNSSGKKRLGLSLLSSYFLQEKRGRR